MENKDYDDDDDDEKSYMYTIVPKLKAQYFPIETFKPLMSSKTLKMLYYAYFH